MMSNVHEQVYYTSYQLQHTRIHLRTEIELKLTNKCFGPKKNTHN